MSIELGTVGIWRHSSGLTPDVVTEVEALGYGAIWLGGSPDGDLGVVDQLLDATERIVVGTSIVNVWKDDAATVAASYHRIAASYQDRFLLGLGIGHPEATREYQRPYDKLVGYLDQLDDLKVPASRRALAALGPRVLRLSAERSAGALPYLVTPEHTRQARQILGDGPLLAPEQKLVLETDPDRARAIGRPRVQNPYLGLTNYVSNLRKLGWTDADLADGGSDALIDALVVHGDADAIAGGVTAHLEAGADHVAVQVLNRDPLPALRALAGQLRLSLLLAPSRQSQSGLRWLVPAAREARAAWRRAVRAPAPVSSRYCSGGSRSIASRSSSLLNRPRRRSIAASAYTRASQSAPNAGSPAGTGPNPVWPPMSCTRLTLVTLTAFIPNGPGACPAGGQVLPMVI
ncbi:MAG TPA: LLM class F420-dependent oxidoreductase [Streptosporangiaceae bacterium]|nr:LLM class F420-dependent oxidoreductase [Streptosporangiaceae bacterium]